MTACGVHLSASRHDRPGRAGHSSARPRAARRSIRVGPGRRAPRRPSSERRPDRARERSLHDRARLGRRKCHNRRRDALGSDPPWRTSTPGSNTPKKHTLLDPTQPPTHRWPTGLRAPPGTGLGAGLRQTRPEHPVERTRQRDRRTAIMPTSHRPPRQHRHRRPATATHEASSSYDHDGRRLAHPRRTPKLPRSKTVTPHAQRSPHGARRRTAPRTTSWTTPLYLGRRFRPLLDINRYMNDDVNAPFRHCFGARREDVPAANRVLPSFFLSSATPRPMLRLRLCALPRRT